MGQNLAKKSLVLATSHLDAGLPPGPDDALEISRSQLTRLMLESHRKAINSAEEIMCLKEIGKINGLYEDTKPKVTINIEAHAQKLEVMSDEELLKLSNQASNLLDLPQQRAEQVVDAEIIEET